MMSLSQSWNTIKRYAGSFLGIKQNLENKILETTALVKIAMKNKDEGLVIDLRRQRAKLFAMRPTASEVSSKTKKYLPQWTKVAESNNLGLVVTATLGVAGITAAAYVAVKGMQLLKDFQRESSIIDRLKDKTLTMAEAKGLIKSAAAFEPPTGFSLGMGMASMIPIILIGGFLFMKMR